MTDRTRAPRHRGRGWVSLGRGVRRAADVEGDLLTAELEAWQARLPAGSVFSHLTAARLHGLWLPPVPDGIPIFVSISRSTPRPRRPQLLVTRHPVPPQHVLVGTLRVATVPETLLACARDVAPLDLLVLVDAALHLRRADLDEITAAARLRRRGARRLAAALALADARSESPWESVLRLFHVTVEAPVVPQATIVDADGHFVARADLLLAGTLTLHEYDGAGHRDARQHRSDLRRERALIEAGHVRRGYTAHDLRWRPTDILRDVDRALGRPHDPARLQRWTELWEASMFSVPGTRAMRQRWHVPVGPPDDDPCDQIGADPLEGWLPSPLSSPSDPW